MNNYWNTNYRASQGGRFTFHYVVTSAALTNAEDLSRRGWEEITPLEADIVMRQDKALSPSPTPESNSAKDLSSQINAGNTPGHMSAVQGSFLESSDPNLFLETWKPAEHGNGTILRLLDLAGTERSVTIRIPTFHIAQVWKTNALERGAEPESITKNGHIRLTIHPHEILTLRILGNPL
jgi:alpha-mannosidase